jgi:UPF0716 protein FxsA
MRDTGPLASSYSVAAASDAVLVPMTAIPCDCHKGLIWLSRRRNPSLASVERWFTEPETLLFYVLLALLIVVPLVELYILIQVGSVIGALPTIAMVIGISIFGAWMLKRQGMSALLKADAAMKSGKMPVEAVLDSVALIAAGALLMTPGLLTDALGVLLLIPPVRRRIARALLYRLMKNGMFKVQTFSTRSSGARSSGGPQSKPGGGRSGKDGPVIDGEFERLDGDGKPK